MTHLPPGNSTIVNTRHQAIPGATVAPDAGAIVVTFSTVRPSSLVFTVWRRIANAVSIVLAAMAVVAIGFVSVVHAGHPKVAGKGEAIEAPAPISPYDAMVKKGNSLPVEYWPIRSDISVGATKEKASGPTGAETRK